MTTRKRRNILYSKIKRLIRKDKYGRFCRLLRNSIGDLTGNMGKELPEYCILKWQTKFLKRLLREALSQNYLYLFENLILGCSHVDILSKATRRCIRHNYEGAFEILKKHKKLHLDHIDDYGRTALRVAVKHSMDWTRRLVDCGANVNAFAGYIGSSPLAYAILRGDVDMAALLLEHGARVDIPDIFGRTALTVAVRRNSDEILKMIFGKGCDVHEPDKIIMIAIRRRDFELMDFLLKGGADPDCASTKKIILSEYLQKFKTKLNS